MKRGLKPLPEQTAMDLTFRTIPLEPPEKYVSLQFLPNTVWQIARIKDGIYLAQDVQEESAQDYKLSNRKDRGISNLSPLIIGAGESHFVIPYNKRVTPITKDNISNVIGYSNSRF